MTDRKTLRKLAQEATPGPWFDTSEDDRPTGSVGTNPLTNDIMLCWSEGRAKADARYIAAASPTAILSLLDEIDALREVAEAAKALLPILDEHLFERGPEEDALRSAIQKMGKEGGEG